MQFAGAEAEAERKGVREEAGRKGARPADVLHAAHARLRDAGAPGRRITRRGQGRLPQAGQGAPSSASTSAYVFCPCEHKRKTHPARFSNKFLSLVRRASGSLKAGAVLHTVIAVTGDCAMQVWHPDKHPDNQEEAKERFQQISKAYESLMSTEEDARIEALAHK